jgi:hypothetical protein
VAGVWLASQWRWVGWNRKPNRAFLQSGMITLFTDPDVYMPYTGPQVYSWRAEPGASWIWFTNTSGWEKHWSLGLIAWGSMNGGTQTVFEVAFWPLPLLLTLAGVPVLVSGVRARRRAKVGACPACGYDRRGIPAAAVCPECGKKTV